VIGTARVRLLALPATPFIPPLIDKSQEGFLSYIGQSPDHVVRLCRLRQAATAEWALFPRGDVGAYRLAFKLPEHIEGWIGDVAEKERKRTMDVREQFLSSITTV
jgi:hypothetical protein